MNRRQIMGGMAAVCALGTRGWADAGTRPVLLVGGPDGASTSRWGNACALAMQPGFPGSPAISTQPAGGLDGVTVANQLDALVVPDGKTAAILPGAALIAWLTGDSRVHFDPTRWVPVMAGSNSGVLMVRLPPSAAPDLESLRAMAPLRLAADQPQSNDLAVLLGLARLGVKTAPLFGLRDIAAKTRAFEAGQVDAVFVSGENVPADLAPLRASGAVPVLSLGRQLENGAVGGDPLFPAVPDMVTFSGNAAPLLDAAYHAAAAAARLDFMVVLPKLTGPGPVARWRQGAAEAMGAPALQAAADASGVALQPAPVLTAALSALSAAPEGKADLQAFLSTNFGWQPG